MLVTAGADDCQRGTIASCGSSATRAVNSPWTIAGRASASSIRRSARRVIGIPSACARKYNRVTRSRRSRGEYHFARGMDLVLSRGDGRRNAPPKVGRIPRYNGASQFHITRVGHPFQAPEIRRAKCARTHPPSATASSSAGSARAASRARCSRSRTSSPRTARMPA